MTTDQQARPRTIRIRWFLTILVSFTAGTLAAATLFAFSSRIPIPLKISPTRGADDLLRNEPKRIVESIEFPERLQSKEIGGGDAPEPTRTSREPVLPEPTGPAATEAARAAKAKPAAIPATPDKLSYYIQAGAFADAVAANGLVDELNGIEIQASVRLASGNSGDKLFRVLIGPYEKAAAAESVRAQLGLLGRTSTMMRLPAI